MVSVHWHQNHGSRAGWRYGCLLVRLTDLDAIDSRPTNVVAYLFASVIVAAVLPSVSTLLPTYICRERNRD